MLEAVAVGNPKELSYYYNNLLPIILERLSSPLAAPYLAKLFLNLSVTVFDKSESSVCDLVAHVTLRLEKPQCDLDPAWEEESLEKAMIRTLRLIHELVINKNTETLHNINAPNFCYLFPFIKLSLLSSYARKDDNFIHNGLQIISAYAKLRGNLNDNPMMYPKLLPRRQMFDLLIKLISREPKMSRAIF